jgi:hypothetical protein
VKLIYGCCTAEMDSVYRGILEREQWLVQRPPVVPWVLSCLVTLSVCFNLDITGPSLLPAASLGSGRVAVE